MERRSRIAPVLALIAGVAGVALLVIAVARFVGLIEDDVAVTETTTFLSTTTAPAPTSSTTTTSTPTFSPGDVATITDDSGALSFSVPSEWSDVSGRAWVVDGDEVGISLGAAPDLDAWYSSWGTPGVFVGVSTTDLVPGFDDFSGACTRGNTAERAAGSVAGTVEAWSACGDEGSDFHVFVGGTPEAPDDILIQLVSVNGDGLALLDELMTTLSYRP